MSFAAGRPVLAIPGPSPVPDRVLRAMHRPSPDIYGGELTGLNLRVMADLKRLAGTVQHVAPYIGNGHAAWEAANMNLFAPGDRALVLVSGHFGSSWANTAEAMGVQVERMEAEPFAAVDPQRLRDRLAADRAGEIRAVLVCQVDTASSVRSDIPTVREAMGDHPAALAVDAIASLGCEPMHMDDWGVDVLVSASQKGLMVPPGLGFVWYSEKVAAGRGAATPIGTGAPAAARRSCGAIGAGRRRCSTSTGWPRRWRCCWTRKGWRPHGPGTRGWPPPPGPRWTPGGKAGRGRARWSPTRRRGPGRSRPSICPAPGGCGPGPRRPRD